MATVAVTNKLGTIETRVLILLVISVCINYIARGTLSVVAPPLKEELHLDPNQLGILLSSFFATYAGFQIVSGWLVDRYDVRWVYGAGYLLWSVATCLTGLANGFVMLLALRLLLGIGESVAFPSYSKIIATNFPQTHRGIANGLVDIGL